MAQPAHLVVVPVRNAPVRRISWARSCHRRPQSSKAPTERASHVRRFPRGARWFVRACRARDRCRSTGDRVRRRARRFRRRRRRRAEGAHVRRDAPELLEREGITSTDDDLLEPSSALSDSTTVRFRRAKRIELVLDGANEDGRRARAHGRRSAEGSRPRPRSEGSPPPGGRHAAAAGAADVRPQRRPREAACRRPAARRRIERRHRRDAPRSRRCERSMLTTTSSRLGRPSPPTGCGSGWCASGGSTRSATSGCPSAIVTQNDAELGKRCAEGRPAGSRGLEGAALLRRCSRTASASRPPSSERRVAPSARDHIVRVGTREPQYSREVAVRSRASRPGSRPMASSPRTARCRSAPS